MNTVRHPLWVVGLLAILAAPLATANPAHSPTLPEPAMTPSDVLTTDAATICVPGYTKTGL